MRNLLLLLCAFFAANDPAAAQSTPAQPLRTETDTFYLWMSNRPPERIPIAMNRNWKDTVDMGFDGAPGNVFVRIYAGKDSMDIACRNFPLAQRDYVKIESPKRKVTFRLRFNARPSFFSDEYVAAAQGNVAVEVPEVYELANIIWNLSPAGQTATNLNKQGAYYERVKAYFSPYLSHPVFAKISTDEKNYFERYYDFRENSLCFSFDANRIVGNGPYYYVMGGERETYHSFFKELLPLVQDFADRSRFRDFYAANKAYYAQQIEREKTLMPAKKMWAWIEKEFPGNKYDHYKIVFSPLINATHSTQNFGQYLPKAKRFYWETVMFVCGPEVIDRNQSLSETEKEGSASGIVFTEIDHNYVNPVTSQYAKTVDSIFSNRSYWTAAGGDTDNYSSPQSVFNEYMTHALFCVYVRENYSADMADKIIKARESLMVDRRHYTRFREFNAALQSLRNEHSGATVQSLYPQLLQWCKGRTV